MKTWKFASGQKKHTQDGTQLVRIMKGIGYGRKQVLAVDVGCGDGIIAHDLIKRHKATHVMALDRLASAARLAKENLERFGHSDKAQVLHMSAQKFFRDSRQWDRFDRFVINPPFFAAGSGKPNRRPVDQQARHEKTLKLRVWARGARRLLKTGGELYCVFPTERLSELFSVLTEEKVEPKELWWFQDDIKKRRFFLRAVRNAKSGLIVHFNFKIDTSD